MRCGRWLVLVVVAVAALVPGRPAHACSCELATAAGLAAQARENGDALVAGTVVAGPEPDGPRHRWMGETQTWELAVDHVVVGDVAELVTVGSADGDGACGITNVRGADVGWVLERSGDDWFANSCATAGAQDVRALPGDAPTPGADHAPSPGPTATAGPAPPERTAAPAPTNEAAVASPPVLGLLVGAVVVVAGAGLAVGRRRRGES